MPHRRHHRTRLLLGREDLCKLRIEQLTALADYLGYEVILSSRPNPRYSGLIRFGHRIGVWAPSAEQQLSALAHEICHAGLWELRIRRSYIERHPGGTVEEGLCYAFESFVLGVLLDRWPRDFRASDLYYLRESVRLGGPLQRLDRGEKVPAFPGRRNAGSAVLGPGILSKKTVVFS
jgi:hypothetical protein